MAIDFPASPTNGQTYVVGSVTYTWDGTKWTATASGGGGSGDIITEGNTSAEVIDTGSDGRFVVTTEGTEALRVDANGRLGVGVSSPASAIDCLGTLRLRNDTSSAVQFYTAAGAAEAHIFYSQASNTLEITNFLSGNAIFKTSDAERMRILANGEIRCCYDPVANISSAPESSQSTTGTLFGATSGSYLQVGKQGGVVASFNRQTNDGAIISLRQAGTEEGTISVSGTTVSYNGAHLSRWSQLSGIDPYDKTVRPEILRGTVMSNLDEMCDWTCPTSGDCQDNEQLNKTKISDVEGDKNLAGVFQSWDDDDETWVNDFYLAMTGDFVIRIAAGTTVQRGDLLMSAGDGTAKPQDDDIIRSKTIAKVTSTNVSCTYDDGSYCVPCVLMAC